MEKNREGGLPPGLKKQFSCPRSRVKLPNNPVQRLQLRELGGIHRCHQQSIKTQIFHKLPGRLGFSLHSLVDESVLHDGHVFLGFTKNGQFVLSYSLNVETDEHSAYPIYAYRLQWWRFIPYKRLRKVAEVRLFGEEDIQQEVFLAVSEWPTDDSRILIHGYCLPSDNEEKHQCYVTITAFPPVDPCEDCSQLAIFHAQQGFHGTMFECPPRCLNHAFTVHTKYEVAPPYPSFTPKIFLKLDGIVVLNTGDSLIALSVDIEDNHGGFGFGLYSPRVTRSVSNVSTASSSHSEDQMSCESQDRLSDARVLDDVEHHTDSVIASILGRSPIGPMARNPSTPSTKDPVNNPNEYRTPIRDRHTSAGKENLLNKSLGSPKPNLEPHSSNPASRNETPNTKLQQALEVYNFEGSTPNHEPSGYFEIGHEVAVSGSAGRAVRAPLSFHQSARMPTNAASDEISLYQPDNMDSQPLDELEKPDLFEKPTSIPRLQTSPAAGSVGTPRVLTGLSLLPPDAFQIGKNLNISPGCGGGKWDTTSSTCSSCVSSPLILQSDSQCFTYSVRRYIESYGVARPDSPVDIEDDLNLAYHSILPLEVHGANYCSLRLLTKQCLTPQMPCIVVKQLTLDLEHYLGETVRTAADWGHRYLAFTDYDVQIVEVCPDTAEVIAVVFVLIRARPPKEKKHVHGMRSVPRLYQTGFKLVWNLKTGSYTTLDIEDLVEVNQTELMRKRWHPGHRISDALKRRFAVPQVYAKSVHVLTNEAVFKGQSLKMLLDRQHYVAILL